MGKMFKIKNSLVKIRKFNLFRKTLNYIEIF